MQVSWFWKQDTECSSPHSRKALQPWQSTVDRNWGHALKLISAGQGEGSPVKLFIAAISCERTFTHLSIASNGQGILWNVNRRVLQDPGEAEPKGWGAVRNGELVALKGRYNQCVKTAWKGISHSGSHTDLSIATQLLSSQTQPASSLRVDVAGEWMNVPRSLTFEDENVNVSKLL